MLDRLLRRGFWVRCQHHSQRWPHWRSCLRGQSYDHFCLDHNGSCFNGSCHYPKGAR
jgi:hypothetical protein